MALRELRRAGINDRLIRAASAALPKNVVGCAYLVFDGKAIHARVTAKDAVDLLMTNPGSRVLMIEPLAERLS